MSMITKPIMLDETGRQIASILEGIRDAISSKSVDVPNMPGVKFIDYDGTVVYFAGREEVLHMKKLPDAPVHVDLTAQGWNWSLADIKAYMTKYPDAVMTVGQMYIPSDGKTHMIMELKERLTIPLTIQQTVSEGVTINWGDGSEEETIEGTDVVTTSHTYTSEGEYEITFEVAEGCELGFGDGTNNVFGSNAIIQYLKKLYIGNSVTSIGDYAFNSCTVLTSLTIPDGITSIGNSAFANCHFLTSLTIPNGITSIENNAFSICSVLTSLTIPDSVTSIGSNAFMDCYALTSLTIPDNVTSIEQQTFMNCWILTSLSLPDGVTSIGTGGFTNCRKLFILSVLSETPPTLSTGVIKSFSNMPTDCTIYVPYGTGDTYKAASGWSTWASQIQELPE